jgi:hypothetical protein
MPQRYVKFSPTAPHLSTHNLIPDSDFSSSSHGSFMEMLNDSFVDTDGPPLAPFGGNDLENLSPTPPRQGKTEVETDDEETDADCEMEEVTEVETGEVKKRKKRAMNYTEVEDTTLCRAWAQVGLDAASGMDQTGKRYWQRIKERFCQLMPRVKPTVYRSFRSLQGHWEVIKPACSRWSAAMDKVTLNPPSGSTIDLYVSLFNPKSSPIMIIHSSYNLRDAFLGGLCARTIQRHVRQQGQEVSLQVLP